LKDLYKEFNHSVNHLIVIREFLHDLLDIKDEKEPIYETLNIIQRAGKNK